MLPDIDGFEVCRRLRADGVWAPVLMLTARDGVDDRVAGLDGGADDYLTKPFAFAELLRDCGRWCAGAPDRPAVLRPGACGSTPRPAVHRGERRSSCPPPSSRCSRRSCAVPGRSLASQLLEHVWDDAYENRSNVVDVYVRYLREKIDEPFGTDSIETVRGVGYRLRAEGS